MKKITKDTKLFTRTQLFVLVLLRLLIGWHLLFEGISKLTTPGWTSKSFLSESKWILSGFAEWIISNKDILNIVDFLNTWGLIAIGLGLIIGLFARVATISGAVLLIVYYLNSAPLIGLEYSVPMEGNYLVVNKTLIEAVSMLILVFFPTSSILGLDALICSLRIKKNKQI